MKKQKKLKMNSHHAVTIDEAIDDLYTFLDCDMWSKFYPMLILQGRTMYRQDPFRSEKEFRQYLEDHFNILRKEIKRIRRQNERKEKKK